MMVESKRLHNYLNIRQRIENHFKCPVCRETIEIGVDLSVLRNFSKSDEIIFPHFHLHGTPLHAVLCQIDTHLVVRNVQSIESVEIFGDTKTFDAMIKKWVNPL